MMSILIAVIIIFISLYSLTSKVPSKDMLFIIFKWCIKSWLKQIYRLYSSIFVPRILLVLFHRLFCYPFVWVLQTMILRKMHGYPSHHEYLRDTLRSKHEECLSCMQRKVFTCVKCRYCWSCHWKKENEELEGSPQIMLIAIWSCVTITIFFYIETRDLLCFFKSSKYVKLS